MTNENKLKNLDYEKIWRKTLGPDEEVKYEFSIGKKYRYLGLFSIGLLGLLISIGVVWLGIIIILFGLFYFGWYLKVANAYAFTDKRVLIHRGWLSTKLISVDYDKITDVSVEEPFLDRLITKTGHLSVNTAGTTFHEVILKHIQKPYEIKKRLDSFRT